MSRGPDISDTGRSVDGERSRSVRASDGTRLHVTERGSGAPLVLLHGWCFSGRFFFRNVGPLAEHARVITIDLRGHGDSEAPGHGYRIARFAKDLHDVLTALDLHDVTVLGWSLGCPVIWSYLELFGTERLAGAVFVEQTPRQYFAVDWPYAHAQSFDDASLAAMLTEMRLRTGPFDETQLDTILEHPLPQEDRAMLLAEMAKAPPDARAAIMTDHTRHDWRDLLPTVRLPVLVCVAQQDRVFDWRGPASVAEAIPGARLEHFEHSGHALFLDEPEHFDRVVSGFLGGLERHG